MNRKVIYTCIVGNYDPIRQPLVVDNSFDYICFTDNCESDKVGVWEIRPIPETKETDKTRMSRYVKILPHKALEAYDYSLYIDANIQIVNQSFYDVINKKIEEEILFSIPIHPQRSCVYDEIIHVYFTDKVNLKDARRQLQHLKKQNYPAKHGLYENNLLLRKHNDCIVKKISKEWWDEYLDYSRRDQFSLVYVCWKNGFVPDLVFGKDMTIRNCPYIKYYLHPPKDLSIFKKNNSIRLVGRYFKHIYKKINIMLFLSEPE